MKYIKITNDTIINYTLEELFIDYPDADIYKNSQMPNRQLLEKYNVYPLITTTIPNDDNVIVTGEGLPKFIDGEWHQTWVTRSLTEEEKLSKLNEDLPFFVDKEISTKRYNICKSCENFISLTTTCKECGCFMIAKTKIQNASCPLEKW